MNSDLEETLRSMGPDYRAVVARLLAADGAQTGRSEGARGWLVAASLVVLAGLGALAFRTCRPSRAALACVPSEYRASVEEMIATQNPDGSWKNDFLTRRNLALLGRLDTPRARLACKKAARNLRLRGLP